MKDPHPLIFMFDAPGFRARSIAKSDLTISLQASLAIPFKDICQEDSQEKFKFSKHLQAQKAYHFFEQSFFEWHSIQIQAILWLSKYPTKN